MKIIALLLTIFFFNFYVKGQNLVTNGNFESGDYNGGADPINYYSGTYEESVWHNLWNLSSHHRFDADVQDWKVAEASKLFEARRRDSPDWMDGNCTNTRYVRCAFPNESIMTKLVNGHKLVKGQTYKFKIKARGGKGASFPTHNFQLVFTKDDKGLNTNKKNKWIAGDFYVPNSCHWHYFEHVFTVPNDDKHKYSEMDYLVIKVNYYRDGSNKANDLGAVFNFDDVVLLIEPACIDVKYIQDRIYAHEHKIEQANVEIRAGAHVSPYLWESEEPVIVKSSAKVIYRAPSVFLEPGFFIEEPGSYFETQVGTCVDDPCPQIPSFSPPPVINCDLPIVLGNDLPHIPGVFYTWKPESVFESPWSRTTNFNPPTGSGCLNAELTIWTICGKWQTYPFALQYFDGPPVITIPTIINNSWQIYFNMGISNASNYTVQLINPTTQEVVYEENKTISCNAYGSTVNVKITQCNVNLCRDFILKVIAHNGCGDPVIITRNIDKPIVSAPEIDIHNLVSTDFDLQFDLFVTEHYDYLIVETWNESMSELVCSQTYSRCGTPLTNFSLHYDAKSCLGDCPSKCKNYKIKIRLKNYCNDIEDTEIINWNKSTTTFSMPNSYPNVITLNNDGINESLCFSPTGADYYHIVVIDRWGIPLFEQSGCVNADPMCIWSPSSNTPTDVYFYDVTFANICGQSGTQHNFVQIFNPTKIGEVDEVKPPSPNSTFISVYPNPTNGDVTIYSIDPILEVELQDNAGKIILQEKIQETFNHKISFGGNVNGLYLLKIKTTTGFYFEKIEKR